MKTYVIGTGGSIIAPEKFDIEFLKKFKELILSYVEKGCKFVLIIGGGAVCRKYQNGLREIGESDNEVLDWLGIETTYVNAKFLKYLFKDYSSDVIIKDPTKPIEFDKPIIVGGGYKPGWSTDYDAILIANQLNCDKMISLSNIEYVYDKDPNRFDDAKPMEKISFDKLLKMAGEDWSAGKNMPLDPSAIKFGKEKGLKVILANGKNLDNLKNILDEKEFIGTMIE